MPLGEDSGNVAKNCSIRLSLPEAGLSFQMNARSVVRPHQDLRLRAFLVVARGHQFVGDLGDDELLIQAGRTRS